MSANHGGDIAKALRIIDEAKRAGCDAVKIQVYDPYKLARARGGLEKVVQTGPWAGRNLLSIYTEGATHYDWLPMLDEFAEQMEITLFPSVFDTVSLAMVEDVMDPPAYKISSFDLLNTELVTAICATGKPIIASTGMASDTEIRKAIAILQEKATADWALLHCVSAYPCAMDRANVRRIAKLGRITKGRVPVGYSDHTLGIIAAVASVAVGAEIIEKHLKLSDDDRTLDASFSATPHEMAALVGAARLAWCAVGDEGVEEQPHKDLRVVT
jgi:N-acetylneuraminate synthase